MKNAIHMPKSVTDTICNSFIITTEDNKLIVIDGGLSSETEYFLSYLKKVTDSEKPHIDAWFLTHPHYDDVNVFLEVVENYYDEFTLDKLYVNFPSRGFFVGNDEEAVEMVDEFHRLLPIFADKMNVVTGGDELYIGKAYVKVLYSYDFEIPGANNSSLVFRMDMGGKSVLFTGDCEKEAGRKILRLWKDSGWMKCDICQMSHHGQNGCDKEFYEAVSPKICLWGTPSWIWNNLNGTGPFEILTVRGWMDELGVEKHYIMKDGTHVVEL